MSIRSKGTVGQLQRFLAKPPPTTHEAVLMTNDARPMTLQVYARDQLTPALAEEVCASVDEHGEARPGTECTLVCRDDAGKVLAEKLIAPAPRQSQSDDEVFAARFASGGDPLSQAQNAQRHAEVMARLYARELADNFKALRDVLKDVAGQLTEERKFTKEAQMRQLELARELSEVEIPAPDTGNMDADAQAAAMQVQLLETLKPIVVHLAPVLVQKLLAPPAAAPAPATGK